MEFRKLSKVSLIQIHCTHKKSCIANKKNLAPKQENTLKKKKHQTTKTAFTMAKEYFCTKPEKSAENLRLSLEKYRPQKACIQNLI